MILFFNRQYKIKLTAKKGNCVLNLLEFQTLLKTLSFMVSGVTMICAFTYMCDFPCGHVVTSLFNLINIRD